MTENDAWYAVGGRSLESSFPRVLIMAKPAMSDSGDVVVIDLARRKISRAGRYMRLGPRRRPIKWWLAVAMITSRGRVMGVREICWDGMDVAPKNLKALAATRHDVIKDLAWIGLRVEKIRLGAWKVIDAWNLSEPDGVAQPDGPVAALGSGSLQPVLTTGAVTDTNRLQFRSCR